MKIPQKLKYRKYFKFIINGSKQITLKKDKTLRGKAFLQVLNEGKLNASEIESCRVSIRRMSKKKKRRWLYWQKLFTYCPIFKKTIGLRMGKGKGNLKKWFSPVRAGQIVFLVNDKRLKYKLALKKRKSLGGKILMYFKAFAKAWRRLSVKSEIALIRY